MQYNIAIKIIYQVENLILKNIPDYYRRDIKRNIRKSIVSLIIGLVLPLVLLIHDTSNYYETISTVVSTYSYLRDFISYPILSSMGWAITLNTIVYILLTNIVYEALFMITLPGIIVLSKLLLYLKYFMRGLLLFSVISTHPYLSLLILILLIIELFGFSASATTGHYLGVSIFRPSIISKDLGRLNALKINFRNLLLTYVYLIIPIFIFSAILETLLLCIAIW